MGVSAAKSVTLGSWLRGAPAGAFAARGASVPPRQRSVGAALSDEDQPRRVEAVPFDEQYSQAWKGFAAPADRGPAAVGTELDLDLEPEDLVRALEARPRDLPGDVGLIRNPQESKAFGREATQRLAPAGKDLDLVGMSGSFLANDSVVLEEEPPTRFLR